MPYKLLKDTYKCKKGDQVLVYPCNEHIGALPANFPEMLIERIARYSDLGGLLKEGTIEEIKDEN